MIDRAIAIGGSNCPSLEVWSHIGWVMMSMKDVVQSVNRDPPLLWVGRIGRAAIKGLLLS